MKKESRRISAGIIDRRQFVQLFGTAAFELMMPLADSHGHAQSSIDLLRSDPRRPQLHLLPARNWMNDPNGPVFFGGKYHMFFQYNPEAPVWGNMSWNHAISEDMIHWQLLPVALTPTPSGPDAAGCFSGSTLAVKRGASARVYAIYTGVVHDKKNETIRNEGLQERQCLAWSDDPMLLVWQKRREPLIEKPPPDMRITGFRDPSVWKQGDMYLMALGAGIERVGGCVLLYRSKDLLRWDFLHPMVIGSWNGVPTSNPVDDGEMWECPEIFPLGDRHVLIYSSLRKVFWQSGVLDASTLKFTASSGGMLDIGTFYAPKTQLDAMGRRVLWGWIPERNSEMEMRRAGWSGMMALPRVLTLDKTGILEITALAELSSLRRVAINPKIGDGESTLKVPQCKGEVVCYGARSQSILLTLGDEKVRIRYTADDGKIFVNDNDLSLKWQDGLTVHVFIDSSVAEIFLNKLVTLTKRFYYEGGTAPDATFCVKGSEVTLEGWELSSISTDRLTTIKSNI